MAKQVEFTIKVQVDDSVRDFDIIDAGQLMTVELATCYAEGVVFEGQFLRLLDCFAQAGPEKIEIFNKQKPCLSSMIAAA